MSKDFLLKIVLFGDIDNKIALVQILNWCQTGNKQLPEPRINKFQCEKLETIFTGLLHNLFFNFMVISDVYRSFIPNKQHLLNTVLLGRF